MRLALTLAASLALAGCATVPPPAAPSSVEASRLSARADTLFEQRARDHDLSGALLVRHDGQTVLRRTYGYADWEAERPHDAATRYSAASITKGLTAAAVVKLSRAGQLDLAAPVARYVPALAGLPPFTVTQVLAHEAGLPRDLPDDWAGGTVSAWLASYPDTVGPLGEEHYSNVGYAVLAEVVAAASGRAFTDYIATEILRPAGMTDSALVEGTAADVANGSKGYSPGPAPLDVMPAIEAPLEPGASGLVATADDLALWVEGLAKGAYPEFFVPDDPLGSVDRKTGAIGEYISVQGSLPGYFANAIAWNGGRDSVVFAGNLFAAPALSMRDDLLALVGDTALAATPPRPAEIAPTAAHTALLGRWRTDDFGDVLIARSGKDGSYRLSMIGKPAYWSFHLTPIAGGFHWRAFGRIVERQGDAVTMRALPDGKAKVMQPLLAD